MEIKKAAKAGNKPACTVLAKQLVQLRKTKQRTYAANSQVFILANFKQNLKLIGAK